MRKNWSWRYFAFQLLPTGKNLTYFYICSQNRRTGWTALFFFFPLIIKQNFENTFPAAYCVYSADSIRKSYICIIHTRTYCLYALWCKCKNLLHHSQSCEENTWGFLDLVKSNKIPFFFGKLLSHVYSVRRNNSAHF